MSLQSAGEKGDSGRSGSRTTVSIALVLLVSIGLLIAITLVSASLGAYASWRNMAGLIESRAEAVTDALTDRLENHLIPADEQLKWLVEMIERGDLVPDDPNEMAVALQASLAAVPQIDGVAYLDPAGTTLAAFREQGLHRAQNGPAAKLISSQAILRQEPYWTSFVYEAQTPDIAAARVRPVTIGGEYLGALVAVVSVDELSRIFRQTGTSFDVTAFALTDDDFILAHPGLVVESGDQGSAQIVDRTEFSDRVLHGLHDAEPYFGLPTQAKDGTLIRTHVVDGRRSLLVYKPSVSIAGVDLLVGVHMNADKITDQFNQVWVGLGVAALLILGAVLVATWLSRRVRQPIGQIAKAASAVRSMQLETLESMPPSPIRELDAQASAFNSLIGALDWFGRYVPKQLVLQLMQRSGSSEIPAEEGNATILFTDIVGFTTISESIGPKRAADGLNEHFGVLQAPIEREDGIIDKYIGDSLMAFWGDGGDMPDHTARATRAAKEMATAIHVHNRERKRDGKRPFRVRIGLHTGSVVAGNIGAPSRIQYTVIGDAVNVAQRIEEAGKALAPDAEVLVVASEEVVRAGDAGLEWVDCGETVLRGRQAGTRLYRLVLDA